MPAPDAALSYSYHPTEQGLFFLERELDGRDVVGNLQVDDEKEILNSTMTQSSNYTGNVLVRGVRFITKADQIVLDGGGNIVGAAQAVGTTGIPMVKHRKQIGDRWYDVYKTDLQNYFFHVPNDTLGIPVALLQAAYPNNVGVNAAFQAGDPATRFDSLAGDSVFNLFFDIEIGPFDENGYAVTRAVDFDGNDITHDLDFLK